MVRDPWLGDEERNTSAPLASTGPQQPPESILHEHGKGHDRKALQGGATAAYSYLTSYSRWDTYFGHWHPLGMPALGGDCARPPPLCPHVLQGPLHPPPDRLERHPLGATFIGLPP